jgi:hypothetical protein
MANRGPGYKWATAYGLLFVFAGFYLLGAGLITLIGENQLGTARPANIFERVYEKENAGRLAIERRKADEERFMRGGSAVFQALLFGATGVAILQMSKVAVALIWVTVVLSGFGVLFRGVTPLDLLLWLVGLGLAIWYTNKRKLRTHEHTKTAQSN